MVRAVVRERRQTLTTRKNARIYARPGPPHAYHIARMTTCQSSAVMIWREDEEDAWQRRSAKVSEGQRSGRCGEMAHLEEDEEGAWQRAKRRRAP